MINIKILDDVASTIKNAIERMFIRSYRSPFFTTQVNVCHQLKTGSVSGTVVHSITESNKLCFRGDSQGLVAELVDTGESFLPTHFLVGTSQCA